MTIRTALHLDYDSDLASGLAKDARAVRRGSGQMVTSLNRVRRVTDLTGRGLGLVANKWTALGGGAAGGLVIRDAIMMEHRYQTLATQFNLTDEKATQFRKTIEDIATDNKISRSGLLDAMDVIADKTGKIEIAAAGAEVLAVAMQAAQLQGRDAGAVYAGLVKTFSLSNEEAAQAIALLYEQGKVGSFPFKDVAPLVERTTAAIGSLGHTGPEAVRQMGALLQVIRDGTGSSQQAATALEAFSRTLNDEQKFNMLLDAGIRFKDANGKPRPITEVFKDIIKVADGSILELSKVFDSEAIRALQASVIAFNESGQFAKLDKMYEVAGNMETINKDAARNASTTMANLIQMRETLLTSATRELAEPLRLLNESLNKLDPDELGAYLEVLGKVALTLAGIYASVKLVQGGFAVSDLIKRARARGGSVGLGRGAAGGVVPVFVTNQGFGGPGGGGYIGGGGKGGAVGRFGKYGKYAFRGAGALGGAYLVGSHLYSNGLPSNFEDGGELLGGVGGGLAGMAAGAAIGSVIPVVGTIIGGLIGGALGSFAGENLGEAIGGVIDINIHDDRTEVSGHPGQGSKVDTRLNLGDNLMNAAP